VSPSRLLTLGLVFQIVICFQVAFTTVWQWYLHKGHVLPVTWVPLVIVLFPLILPGPPRRMLAAAIIAGAMSPLALFLLEQWGKVRAEPDDYLRAVLGPLLGIGFAYMGAKVVYRLGREVAAARQLGSYRLEERLGKGGMGEVWRARHRMLARPAAIKLIRPTGAGNGGAVISKESMSRFEREAQVIAALRSGASRASCLPAHPDLPLTLRGRVVRSHPSRHQAGQHLLLAVIHRKVPGLT
jgi:eukaryotic-like serine/threonine-protein kinase